MVDDELDLTLAKLSRIKNIEELLEPKTSTEDVYESYSIDDSLFRRVYSTSGSMHTSLSVDGRFHPDGFYGQARMIQDAIKEAQAQHVLELCSGQGFNLIYLAKQNPQVQFNGVDLMPAHIRTAQRASRSLNNLSYQVGNIEELDYPSEAFDIVFVVEALFHVSDLAKALSEAYRVLKPGGRMIVFDYYRKKELEALEPAQRKAMRAAENAFVILNPMSTNGFVEQANKVDFKVLKVEDLSRNALPEMMRLNRLIQLVFKVPLLDKVIARVFSSFVIDGIVGWGLMPALFKADLLGYYQMEFERL